ncbi:hypothetical protein Q7P35_006555 [Cladosporium inversicolor]
MPMTTATMPMTFFTSITTPLYTTAWTPKTPAQYALTCLFLVLLCIAFRGLLAARGNMPWLLSSLSPTKKDTPEEVSCCAEEDGLQKTFRGESATTSNPSRDQDGPSRVWEILLRAALDTALAIFSYLLMLAVMTMNTGYFVSVLIGTFAGSVALAVEFLVGGHELDLDQEV